MAPWGEEAEKLSTGLPDDFIITVRSAKFGFPFKDDETGEMGNAQFWAEGEYNIDGELKDGDIRLSFGEAFEPGDIEGTFLIATDQNEKKRVGKNSKYGKFFKSALETGMSQALSDRTDALGGPSDLYEKYAPMWVGAILRIHVLETGGTFKRGPDKGKTWEGRQEVITEFLGWDEAIVGASGNAAAGATTTTAAVPSSAPANGSGNVNVDVLAASAPNFLKFVEDATAAGIDPNDERLTKAFFEAAKS